MQDQDHLRERHREEGAVADLVLREHPGEPGAGGGGLDRGGLHLPEPGVRSIVGGKYGHPGDRGREANRPLETKHLGGGVVLGVRAGVVGAEGGSRGCWVVVEVAPDAKAHEPDAPVIGLGDGPCRYREARWQRGVADRIRQPDPPQVQEDVVALAAPTRDDLASLPGREGQVAPALDLVQVRPPDAQGAGQEGEERG